MFGLVSGKLVAKIQEEKVFVVDENKKLKEQIEGLKQQLSDLGIQNNFLQEEIKELSIKAEGKEFKATEKIESKKEQIVECSHLPDFCNFYDGGNIKTGILYGDNSSSIPFLNKFRNRNDVMQSEIGKYSCLYFIVDLNSKAIKVGHTVNVIAKEKGSIYKRFSTDFCLTVSAVEEKLQERFRVAVWGITQDNQFKVADRVKAKKRSSNVVEDNFRDLLLNNNLNKYDYFCESGKHWAKLGEPEGVGRSGRTEWLHLKGNVDIGLEEFEKEVIKVLASLNKYIKEVYGGKNSSGHQYFRLDEID